MNVNVEISVGELVDKISILRIKLKKITDPTKLQHVSRELESLQKVYDRFYEKQDEHLLESLIYINELLWGVEDELRIFENENRINEDQQTFIKLARSVYKLNDERFRIKDQINKIYGSAIKEVKSYKGT